MNIKTILKRIPGVQRGIQNLRSGMEVKKRENYNTEYQNSIALLYDEKAFFSKIENIHQKLKNNQSVKYYIVATENTKLGIFGYVNCFLPHIAYAISKGYVPVVDMQHFKSIYQKDQENVWELFFEQPFGVGLEHVPKDKAIVCPTWFWYRNLPNSFPLMNDKETALWSRCVEACVRFNRNSRLYLDRERNEILKHPEKTIGVIYRGTTYTKGEAKGHPIQPTMKMLADKAAEMMKRNACDYLYLASDEKSIVDYMETRFPGKVLINQRVYYDEAADYDFSKYNTDGTDLDAHCFQRENNEYLIGIEYISSMNLVANCSCFVGGACGGTTAVLYLNHLRFKEKFVFQLGRYGYDPVPNN